MLSAHPTLSPLATLVHLLPGGLPHPNSEMGISPAVYQDHPPQSENSRLPSGVSPALRFLSQIFSQRDLLIRVRRKLPQGKFPDVVLKGAVVFHSGLTQPCISQRLTLGGGVGNHEAYMLHGKQCEERAMGLEANQAEGMERNDSPVEVLPSPNEEDLFLKDLGWPQSKTCTHSLLSKSKDGILTGLMNASINSTAQWSPADFTEPLLSSRCFRLTGMG